MIEDKAWADVEAATISTDERHFPGLDEHFRCRFVLQIGVTSYTGHLKFLQLCNSVIVIQKLACSESATHLVQCFSPEQNFVETSRDLSDLREAMVH